MTRARNSANLASQGNLFVDITNDRTGIGSVVPAQNLHVAGTAGFHADTTFVGDNYNATWDRSINSLKFVDNARIRIGTDNDLQLYHSGSHSYIVESGTGSLLIQSNNQVALQTTSGENMVTAVANGAVQLMFDHSAKFQTKDYGTNTIGTAVNDGLVVAGVATVTTMNVTGVLTYEDVTSVDSVGIITARQGVRVTVDGGDNTNYISVGAGDDFRVFHDGSATYLKNNTGNLHLKSSSADYVKGVASTGAVELNYGNTKKFETSNTGATVTGTLVATTFSGSGASLTNLPAANLTGTLPAISGANLTNLDASDLASGTVPTARLGSGTASSSTFLRGDSTFATVTSTTINNNANNSVITGSGTANTLEAEANLTFTGSILTVTNNSGASEITLVTPNNTDSGVYFNDGSNSGALSYQHSDNSMRFRVNATEKLRITSGGLVGIGHDTPSSFSSGANNLVVNDAAGAGGITIVTPNNAMGSIFFADSTSATGQGRIRYDHNGDYMTLNTNATEKLRIASDGTTTASGTSDGVLQLTTTDSRGAFIRFGQGGSYHNMVGCADGLTSGDKEDLGIRAADNIIFAAGGSTERLRITSGGVLKIERGSASETALEINTTSTTQACRIGFSESGTRKAEIAYSHDNNQIEIVGKSGQSASIFTNGLERVHIDTNGNIGINATPATSGTLYNTVDHFLVIGDSDTGIAQDGDGQFEIWANNQEIVNFSAVDGIAPRKGIFPPVAIDIGVSNLPISHIFSTNITLSTALIHNGDTDTKIEFSTNKIDLQTGGSSRIYAEDSGVYVRSGFPLAFLASSGPSPHIKSGGTNNQDLLFTTGSGNPTRLQVREETNGQYLGRTPLNPAESALEVKNDVSGTPDNGWYYIKQFGDVARLHYCVFKDKNGSDIAGGPWTINWVAGVDPSHFDNNGSTSIGRYLNLCKGIGIDKPGRGMESSRTTTQVYGAWLAVKRAMWEVDPGMFNGATSSEGGGVLLMPIMNINGEGGSSDHRTVYNTSNTTHIPPNQDGDRCNASQLFCGWWGATDFSSWATDNNSVPGPEDWGPGDSRHNGTIGNKSHSTAEKPSWKDKMLVTCVYK